MSKILLAIANGFEELETASIIDICRRATLDLCIIALEDIQTIGAHNIILKADILLSAVRYEKYDSMIIPGGLRSAQSLAQNPKIKEALKYFHSNKGLIASICAGPLVLNEAGILGSKYTCYPGLEEQINKNTYVDEDVVVDGNIITSKGPATAIKFALEIVKTLKGINEYQRVKKELLFKD